MRPPLSRRLPTRQPPSPIPHDWGVSPCLDLINSRWNDHLLSGTSYDRLPLAKFRRVFLKRWHFKVDDSGDRNAVADLARLRTLLRAILERCGSGGPLSRSMQRKLESEMNRAPMELRIESDRAGLHLHHRRLGPMWDVVMAEIATSAGRLIAERRTIKVCANPNCSWMFVDDSRSGTRRWCSTVCSSLINVRRHRAAKPS